MDEEKKISADDSSVKGENSVKKIEAEDIRVNGEILSLTVSLVILGAILCLVSAFTIGLFLFFVLLAVIIIKFQQSVLLGNSLKVDETKMPRIHKLAALAAKRLNMEMPELFIIQDPKLNAFALGVGKRKSVVLHSSLIDHLDDNELIAVIGHEFTHIKCGHTKWLIFIVSNSRIGIPIFSDIMHLIFLSWSRKSEFTADRGGLLACRDLKSWLTAMAKVASGPNICKELDLDSFLEQKEDLKKDGMAKFAEVLLNHPLTLNRFSRIKNYSRSDDYERLIADTPASIL